MIKPVIFKSDFGSPDVQFILFGQYEFHAHSAVLKSKSVFFRKFLDPSNKELVNGRDCASWFRYKWISEFDEDEEGWRVVSAPSGGGKVNQKHPTPSEKETTHHKAQTFHTLLRALYHQTLPISCASDLNDLTKIADYYRCLPAVSSALDATFPTSYYFTHLNGFQASLLINSASKLRNVTLFTDCVILCAGVLSRPLPYRTMEPEFVALVEKVRGRIERHLQIAELRWGVVDGKEPKPRWFRRFVEKGIIDRDGGDCAVELYGLVGLMENNMRLNPGAFSGEGEFEHYFLCGDFGRDELPWDGKGGRGDW